MRMALLYGRARDLQTVDPGTAASASARYPGRRNRTSARVRIAYGKKYGRGFGSFEAAAVSAVVS
jgi:hypothetical protein